MKGEINRDCFCSAHNSWDIGETYDYEEDGCGGCDCLLHKYPTPEQYKAEYGEDVPDDFPIWYRFDVTERWALNKFCILKSMPPGSQRKAMVVCACTPWGKPPDDWRPA